MDLVFGFPEDNHKNTGILVFADWFSKTVHLVAVPESITAQGSACALIDTVFKLHQLPSDFVSDRDPRFTAKIWHSVFRSLEMRLTGSKSDLLESDSHAKHENLDHQNIIRGYIHSFSSWREFLPVVEFDINNCVHASTHHTPFYVNGVSHSRVHALLDCDYWIRGGGTRSSKNRSGSCFG